MKGGNYFSRFTSLRQEHISNKALKKKRNVCISQLFLLFNIVLSYAVILLQQGTQLCTCYFLLSLAQFTALQAIEEMYLAHRGTRTETVQTTKGYIPYISEIPFYFTTFSLLIFFFYRIQYIHVTFFFHQSLAYRILVNAQFLGRLLLTSDFKTSEKRIPVLQFGLEIYFL